MGWKRSARSFHSCRWRSKNLNERWSPRTPTLSEVGLSSYELKVENLKFEHFTDNTTRRSSWRDHKQEQYEEHFEKYDHKSFYDNTTTYPRAGPSAGYQKLRQPNGDLQPFFESNNNIQSSAGSPYMNMTRMNPPYEEFPDQRMAEKEEEPEW